MPLRVGVFGAEPWTEEMRQEIETKLGIDAPEYLWRLSEVMGPDYVAWNAWRQNAACIF